MPYRKPLDASKWGLSDIFRATLAVCVILAVAVNTHWLFAVIAIGVPLLAALILSLSVRARSDKTSDRLAKCGAIILSVWFVFLGIPSLVLALYFVGGLLDFR